MISLMNQAKLSELDVETLVFLKNTIIRYGTVITDENNRIIKYAILDEIEKTLHAKTND